jgi:hypothetical protein
MRLEAFERGHHVGRAVERLAGRLLLPVRASVHVLEIALHQERAVGQQRAGEVRCGRGEVDRAAEALADERGQVPAVVEVGVRDHHRLELRGREGERAVHAIRILAVALVDSAIEEPGMRAEAQQVARAGHRAGRALEGDAERQRHHRLA